MIKMLTLDIERIKKVAKNRERTPCGKLKNAVMRANNILKILEKDDFKCHNCGVDKNLTIEHFEGRKFAKHDNWQKYRPDRCIVLCVNCHEEKNRRLK